MENAASTPVHYEFAGLRLLPDSWEVEVKSTSSRVALTKIQRNFLLALAERKGEVISYEDLRRLVWPHEPELSRRLLHTVHVTKRHLIKLLSDNGVKCDFIQSVPGKGYRLTAGVIAVSVNASEGEVKGLTEGNDFSQPPSTQERDSVDIVSIEYSAPGKHSTFTAACGLLYGTLYGVALLLEAAYRFDRYGRSAALLGIPLIVINSLAAVTALRFACKRVQKDKGGGLIGGIGLLLGAAILSVGVAKLCLPDEPVTASLLQAQPAWAAFIKNAALYFLPAGICFLLIPFYYVNVLRLKSRGLIKNLPGDTVFLSPRLLAFVWMGALIYSLLTTFYLLDHLQGGNYHNLFVNLIFLRFIIYFGLGLTCVLWYKTALSMAGVLAE